MTLQQGVMLGMQGSIMLTVLGFGLNASMADALFLAKRPALLARSLLAMFVFVPIIAVAADRLLELNHTVEVVLVALAISPTPPLLPRKLAKAQASADYKVGLLVAVSVLAIVLVPLWAWLLQFVFGRTFEVSPEAIGFVVCKMILLPLAIGIALRALAPGVARRVTAPIAVAATVLFLVCVALLSVHALPAAFSVIGSGAAMAFAAFVVVGLAVGHFLAGPPREHRAVLALASACRHPAIALSIAQANFPDEPRLSATIVLYLLIAMACTAPYVAWQRRASSAASSHA